MPLVTFLWNYSPGPPFQAGTTFDATGVAAMSTRTMAGPITFGHADGSITYDGDTQPMFGGDFYNRFHISALSFDLGNLVGDQTRTLTVWNAYRRARVLEALDLVDAEGIVVSGQPPAPLQFGPQQERTYSLAISTDGPPVIQATITFDFDEGQALSVTITGSRVTAWTWPANWSEGITERLEWMTDLLQAYRGEEQARALRIFPRHVIEFSILADGMERRHLEAALWSWSARVWAVPLWWDGIDLSAALPAGSTTIPVSVGLRAYQIGTLAMLLGPNSRSYEVIEIDDVGSGSLTLARPTTAAWPAGTRLYPARASRIDGNASLSRFTGAAAYARMRFEAVDPAEHPADAGAVVYRGFPVLATPPTWTEDPTATLERKLSTFDPGTGIVSVEDEAAMPLAAQALRWELDSRDDIDKYRRRLYALRGKQGRIWVPTWAADLLPVAAVGSTALAIDVEWCGYTLYYQTSINRRDIRIELANGTVLYRRITASSEISATIERLQLDSSLGVDIQPGDFVLVSFMGLFRQSSDAAEISWFTGDAASASMSFRAPRHDV